MTTSGIREVIMLIHYDDNTVAEIRGLKCSSLMSECIYTDPAGNVVSLWGTSVYGRRDLTATYQFRFFDVAAKPNGSMYHHRTVRPPEEKEKK